MGVKKFKFVSPGVQVAEIDNSQLPKVSTKIGPVVIGRAQRGPGMRPVKVESFSEFVNIFGDPVAGARGGDVWRDGNNVGPTYGAYAAQAWLRNNSPLTYVRLLGTQHTDATAAGKAGWETKDSSGAANGLGVTDASGGAYGLFLINSSSNGVLGAGIDSTPATGTLAAVFYINEGSIVLTGSYPDAVDISGSATLVKTIGSDQEFRAEVRNAAGTVVETTTFNFNKNSKKYIRKVFNTNPILTNTAVTSTANLKNYWLGQTYERAVSESVTNTAAGSVFGVMLGLKGDAGTKEGGEFRFSSQAAQTGWFFGQDLQAVNGAANSYQPEAMVKLFRFHCLDTGEWTQKNLKISIEDIKPSSNETDPYGVFSVVIRKSDDSDNAVRVVERFSSCTLNPYSNNYIGKKIGDTTMVWDDVERRYRHYGNHINQSKFIRVEMNGDVDNGATDPLLLPFGVFGPPRHKGFAIVSGADVPQAFGTSDDGTDFAEAHVQGNANIVRSNGDASNFAATSTLSFTGSFLFPALPLRSSSADGNLANPTEAYFGLDTSITRGNSRTNPGYVDYLRPLPGGYDTFAANGTETESSWIFTLDDLLSTGGVVIHSSGSRASGTSVTAASSSNYEAIIELGYDRFTTPLFGGFDGVDIAEAEPFRNTKLEGGTATTNYAFNSVKMAIDSVADPEVVECNLMTSPGLTHEGLTTHILNVCEDRADCLAIVDLKGGFVPSTENTSGDSSAANRGDVDTTISLLKQRGINNSFGCCYFPWVQIRDSINGATLWSPPSVAALGTMANSERKTELWFAPAGFNRGGLTEGSAGIPIVNVRQRLTTSERDKLYESNINPIGSFPNQGIVIFGQKTLQVQESAKDRINVRRLLIFVKKEISRMASNILFDPNIRVTWNRFLGEVNPFLRSVQTRFGLDPRPGEGFKVVLDETTTTPELIDRNTMYAKIFLRPAHAIEFIGIDFVITSQGASFDD